MEFDEDVRARILQRLSGEPAPVEDPVLQEAPPPDEVTPIEHFEQRQREDQELRDRLHAMAAERRSQDMDPKRMVEARRIADERGLPFDTAYRQLPQLQKEQQLAEKKRATEDAPITSEMVKEPQWSGHTAYEIQNMSWIERFFWGNLQALQQGFEMDELAEIGEAKKKRTATPEQLQRYEELKGGRDELQSSYELEGLSGWTLGAVQSAPLMIEDMVMALDGAAAGMVAGGGLGAGIGAMTGPTGAASGAVAGGLRGGIWGGRADFIHHSFDSLSGLLYLEASETLDKDGEYLDHETAAGIANIGGAIQAGAELIPLEFLFRQLPGVKKFFTNEAARRLTALAVQNPKARALLGSLGRITQTGIAEAGTEVIQHLVEVGAIIQGGGYVDSQGNVLEEKLYEGIPEAARQGFMGGTTMGAGVEVLSSPVRAYGAVKERQAQKKREDLVEAGNILRNSDIALQDPDAVMEHARRIDEAGGTVDMSVSSEAVETLFQAEGMTSEQIVKEFPELAREIIDAKQSGVEIKLNAQTIAKLARYDGFEELTKDIRQGQDAFTFREAEVKLQEINMDINVLSQEEQDGIVLDSFVQQLEDSLVINGKQSRDYAKSAVQLVGQLARVRAHRSGQTMKEYLKDFSLDMGYESVIKMVVSNKDSIYSADTDISTTNAFPSWFRVSKVTESSGQPLQVFHSTDREYSSFKRLSHFGTSRAANDRLDQTRGQRPKADDGTPEGEMVHPVYLSIQNPLDVGVETGWDHDGDMWEQVIEVLEARGETDLAEEVRVLLGQGPDGIDRIPGAVAVADELIMDALEDAGYDGIQYTNNIEDQGSVSWVTFRPEQVKSVYNRGTYDPNDPDTLAQSAAQLQDAPLEIEGSGPGGRVLNWDLGAAFDQRHNEKYGRQLDPADEADYKIILESALEDYAEQQEQPDSGDAWYTDDINTAIELTSNIYPQLAEPQFRDLFLTVAALLSPQQKPAQNWENAILAVRNFTETGKLEFNKPNGKNYGVLSHGNGLRMLQHLIDTRGLDEALEWVQSERTGAEMAELRRDTGLFKGGDKTLPIAKFLPSETNLTEKKLGIYAFGPKVGDFMQNSVGIDQNAVTVDLWMARTYNRLLGRLTDVPPAAKGKDIISEVRGRAEREHIKRLVRDMAGAAGIDASAMQAALWYFEQRLFRNHGVKADSQNFSDAARKSLEKRNVRLDEGDQRAESPDAEESSDRSQTGSASLVEPTRDGGGVREAGSLAPLEGAPIVRGATGPDPNLVSVAEQYARDNGIDLKRQGVFVEVDVERAERIAEAYGAMEHRPQDPEVQAAYRDLIDQTMAQYRALEAAGYKFWLFDDSTDPYDGNPWEAMRDLRANKSMAVYSTVAGFGTDTAVFPDESPLLADTGLKWPSGSPDGPLETVYANDLFRAVHDAFGHGLEGAGFRVRGEENAWQAHVRLFTGDAVRALTTETRGQNSWLNYGPHGEANRTASVEDTVFADQKTGLMPEWVSTEGRAPDRQVDPEDGDATLLQSERPPIFISGLLKAVENIKQPKAPAKQWMGILRKTAGVRAEEMEFMGLEQWLDEQSGSVSRDDLLNYIRANQLEIKDIVRGDVARDQYGYVIEDGPSFDDAIAVLTDAVSLLDQAAKIDDVEEAFDVAETAIADIEALAPEYRLRRDVPRGTDGAPYIPAVSAVVEAHIKFLNDLKDNPNINVGEPTEHEAWQSPGGEGYREITLSAPKLTGDVFVDDHWGEPNVVAHMRFAERTDRDGNKRLVIQEIQSDEHQKGRTEGYRRKRTPEEIAEKVEQIKAAKDRYDRAVQRRREMRKKGELTDAQYENEMDNLREEAGDLLQFYNDVVEGGDTSSIEYTKGAVDLPIKTTWQELAFKRMLRWAVENGYDAVSWEGGDANAIVFDSPREVSAVHYIPKQSRIVGYAKKDGVGKVLYDRPATDKDLNKIVGKEIADQLRADLAEGPNLPVGVVFGNIDDKPSITLGGHAKRDLYDRVLPNKIGKLVKQWGGKVERVVLDEDVKDTGVRDRAALDVPSTRPVWEVKITDAMRDAAMDGLPMFQKAVKEEIYARGKITLRGPKKAKITLSATATNATFIHETGHLALHLLKDAVDSGLADAQSVKDLQALYDWMGVKDGKITRNAHEKFAVAFEKYVREGRAPSNDLKAVFRKFRAWLVYVYKSALELDVDLNDDIRTVMDRMLATDQAIKEAKTEVGLNIGPIGQADLMLTDEEYETYVKSWRVAQEEARERLDAKAQAEALVELEGAWRKQLRAIRADLLLRLSQSEGYKAWKGIASKGLHIDPDTIPPEHRAKLRGLTRKGGLHFDDTASRLGFMSGEKMANAISATRQQYRDIDEKAKAIRDQKHGHMTYEDLKAEAVEELQNGEVEEVLLTEFRALSNAAGIKNSGREAKHILQWVRNSAADKVQQLNRRQLEPAKWQRAIVKAAQEVGKHLAKGEKMEAALAKRRQIYATAMHRESIQARARFETIRKKLAPFKTNKKRAIVGKAGEKFLDAIDEMLAAVAFTKTSKPQEVKLQKLREFMDDLDPAEPFTIPDKIMEAVRSKNYQDMTLEELEGLHDAVMRIWHLARRHNKLRDGKELREVNEVLTEVENGAMDRFGPPKENTKLVKSGWDRAKDFVAKANSALSKVEFMLDRLDGSEAGGGLLHRLIYQPMADANKAKFDWLKHFNETIFKKMRKLPKDQKARWAAKRQFMGMEANGQTIIAAALNLGNPENKKKLIEGYGWNERAMMAEINAFMTKEDWDFVQHVWNEIGTLLPDLDKVHRRATGLPLKKVNPAPVATPFGTYDGGYYPIAYDTTHPKMKDVVSDKINENELFVDSYSRATLGDSFTKERTNFVGPILLNLSVLPRHVDQVVHYITHYDAVAQAHKLFKNKRFQKLVRGYLGRHQMADMKSWLTAIAQNRETPTVTDQKVYDQGLKHVRGGVTIMAMGYNPGTAAMQFFGLTSTYSRIGSHSMLRGFASVMNPQAWRDAFRDSQELEPLMKQLDRDIWESIRSYEASIAGGAVNMFMRNAFVMIGATQAVVNMITFKAAMHQAMKKKGMSYDDAVKYADAMIRKTQSAGAIKDLAEVQRGTEGVKGLTMFYSFFSVLYNMLGDIYRDQKYGGLKQIPNTARRIAVLVLLTALLEEGIREGYEELEELITGEEEDEEEKNFILSVLVSGGGFMLTSVPFVREVVDLQWLIYGEGYRSSLTPLSDVPAAAQQSYTAIRDAVVEGDEITESDVKAMTKTVSVATKTPTYGIYKMINGIFGPIPEDD
jgi:hypothetical protein